MLKADEYKSRFECLYYLCSIYYVIYIMPSHFSTKTFKWKDCSLEYLNSIFKSHVIIILMSEASEQKRVKIILNIGNFCDLEYPVYLVCRFANSIFVLEFLSVLSVLCIHSYSSFEVKGLNTQNDSSSYQTQLAHISVLGTFLQTCRK